MASEQWYVLKVRPGFAVLVAQRLRNQHLEVFVPESQSPDNRKKRSTDYVYCRFELENRGSVISVPGVLDILGTPEPAQIDPHSSAGQFASRMRS